MAAAIETMAYFGATPWHGLGTPLVDADLYDWPSACTKSGLDWEVELVPLVTQDTLKGVPARAVRRKTDGSILGTVGPSFHALQNRDAFAWFEPFLHAKEAALHTAGAQVRDEWAYIEPESERDQQTPPEPSAVRLRETLQTDAIWRHPARPVEVPLSQWFD